MRNKKILIVSILVIILCILYIFNAFAHSGRTDSSGGHWNRSNGTYHYHCGGYPAHSHSGGVCPYKKPKTYSSSTSNSSKSQTKAALDKVNKEFDLKGNEYYDGYKEGYNKGHSAGYGKGYGEAKEKWYRYGYDDGYKEGLDKQSIILIVIIFVFVLAVVIFEGLVRFPKRNKKE